MTAELGLRRLRARLVRGRFPVPSPAVRAGFGWVSVVHVEGGLCYGAVEQSDGSHRFGWLVDGGALRVTDVAVSGRRTVPLSVDGAAAIVVSDAGQLVEVPFDGTGPRSLCDLGEPGGVFTAVAPLADGWFAVYRRYDDGPDLVVLRADGRGGVATGVGYALPLYEVMRSLLDGRVLVLSTAEWDPQMLVLGFDAGRLRRLGTLPGELWIMLDATGALTVGPAEPYVSDGDGLFEITGLADAWAAAFGTDDPAPDLPPTNTIHPPSID